MGEPMTEIPNALTAEEWLNGFIRLGGGTFHAHTEGNGCALLTDGFDDPRDSFSAEGRARAPWTYQLERPHALMALANHALPDGDARKITREDVEAIRGVVEAFSEPNTYFSGYMDAVEPLIPIAAKLAALLPPAAQRGS